MGGRHSKGKISQDDLQYLLKNTKHNKEEIKVGVRMHPHRVQGFTFIWLTIRLWFVSNWRPGKSCTRGSSKKFPVLTFPPKMSNILNLLSSTIQPKGVCTHYVIKLCPILKPPSPLRNQDTYGPERILMKQKMIQFAVG